ncbi:MAG TPA: family 14 glycosylhydrolase [Bdellovibrionota bacterium]|jgi:hypothetical protein|nr:family 14 glycosylhydrolase [Bdellovibrionota bacterium]
MAKSAFAYEDAWFSPALQFQPARPPLQHYVMMPLEPITQWESFAKGLQTLKSMGVQGVTTDICWGLVEKEEGRYDWSYYQKLGEVIEASGLKWVNILSTHAIGGNVGDSVDIPIPAHVWKRVPGAEYRYREGQTNRETISFFADDKATLAQLVPFYESWKANIYDRFESAISKIYVGLGPASEARFPSYVSQFGFGYPSAGEMPIYSEAAISSFREFLKSRYGGDLRRLNESWGTSISAFDGAMDGSAGPIPPHESTQEFLEHAKDTPYYRDLLDWYGGVLQSGIHRGLRAFSQAFVGHAHGPLGEKVSIKVAGIHWQRFNPEAPRAAEIATGYRDYDPIFMAAREWRVGVTFTCLEMNNHEHNPWYPVFSDPEGMVRQVLETAHRMGVSVSGENALEMHSATPLETVRRLVEGAGAQAPQAFTALRWHNMIDSEGNATHFGHEYARILVKAVPFKVKYIAPANAETLHRAGFDFYLVPVDPKSSRWQWDDRVALRAHRPDTDVLRATWMAVDADAQYFAIGVIERDTGVRLQMTVPQPKSSFSTAMNRMILSYAISPVPIPPQLDEGHRRGRAEVLSASVQKCHSLLRLADPSRSVPKFSRMQRQAMNAEERFIRRIRASGY